MNSCLGDKPADIAESLGVCVPHKGRVAREKDVADHSHWPHV
jgi:hypothetical protein